MDTWGYWRRLKLHIAVLGVVLLFGGTSTVLATSSNSPNYQATELQFGAGGSLESCSDEFCAQVSIGNIAGGRSEAPDSTADFGPITPEEPLLEVIVDVGESNLGVLSTDRTATTTTIVRVRNYLSNGYILQLSGDPPTYETHALRAPNSPAVSSPGSEQFGVNLVANTDPEVFGAAPQQIPSGDFSFGSIEPGYELANQYMYQSGDTIARSASESGRTDYTISMIVNVSSSTPAGQYSGEYAAIVIPVY